MEKAVEDLEWQAVFDRDSSGIGGSGGTEIWSQGGREREGGTERAGKAGG